VAHILLRRGVALMKSNGTSRMVPPPQPRKRVWQDSVAGGLLAAAVAVIAVTGVDSYVFRLNRWLASVVPAYDPMVTMLVLVVASLTALVLGSVRLKMSARGAIELRRSPRVRGTRIRTAPQPCTDPNVPSVRLR
jgi:hypothetical protein